MMLWKREITLLPFAKTREDHPSPLPSADEYAPQRYSFRTSAATAVKLAAIAGSVFALFWILDTFLAA
jgi:hypothetical protein